MPGHPELGMRSGDIGTTQLSSKHEPRSVGRIEQNARPMDDEHELSPYDHPSWGGIESDGMLTSDLSQALSNSISNAMSYLILTYLVWFHYVIEYSLMSS